MTTIILTIKVTPAALKQINFEYGQAWTSRDLGRQIASDIQQSPIGNAAGPGLTITVDVRPSPLWEVELQGGQLVQVHGWDRAEARQAARELTGRSPTTFIRKL